MNSDHVMVFVTAPVGEPAARLARQIVSDRLAACVNIIPAVRSFYVWEGELQDDSEALLVIKTSADRYEALEARVVELHPYDVPEIIATPVIRGQPAYLAWVSDQTRPD